MSIPIGANWNISTPTQSSMVRDFEPMCDNKYTNGINYVTFKPEMSDPFEQDNTSMLGDSSSGGQASFITQPHEYEAVVQCHPNSDASHEASFHAIFGRNDVQNNHHLTSKTPHMLFLNNSFPSSGYQVDENTPPWYWKYQQSQTYENDSVGAGHSLTDSTFSKPTVQSCYKQSFTELTPHPARWMFEQHHSNNFTYPSNLQNFETPYRTPLVDSVLSNNWPSTSIVCYPNCERPKLPFPPLDEKIVSQTTEMWPLSSQPPIDGGLSRNDRKCNNAEFAQRRDSNARKRERRCRTKKYVSSKKLMHSTSYPIQSQLIEEKIDRARIEHFLIERINLEDVTQMLHVNRGSFRAVCISIPCAENACSRVDNRVKLELRDQPIWAELYLYGNEMIATNVGRRIFPSLSLNVKGLCPNAYYAFVLDMLLLHPHTFKHQSREWIIANESDNIDHRTGQNFCVQEDSPKSGAYWMESGVDFNRVKITNNAAHKTVHMIHVHSMRKYIPRFSIIRVDRLSNPDTSFEQCWTEKISVGHSGQGSHAARNDTELVGSYIIPGTQFYTVTAYQNPDVVRVKIEHNPFARGFRKKPPSYGSKGFIAAHCRSGFSNS